MCKSIGSINVIASYVATCSYCAGMNQLVATVLNHGWWTMQNSMINLVLAISKGSIILMICTCVSMYIYLFMQVFLCADFAAELKYIHLWALDQ